MCVCVCCLLLTAACLFGCRSYKNGDLFQDITTGSNPGCGTLGFQAAPGWGESCGDDVGNPRHGVHICVCCVFLCLVFGVCVLVQTLSRVSVCRTTRSGSRRLSLCRKRTHAREHSAKKRHLWEADTSLNTAAFLRVLCVGVFFYQCASFGAVPFPVRIFLVSVGVMSASLPPLQTPLPARAHTPQHSSWPTRRGGNPLPPATPAPCGRLCGTGADHRTAAPSLGALAASRRCPEARPHSHWPQLPPTLRSEAPGCRLQRHHTRQTHGFRAQKPTPETHRGGRGAAAGMAPQRCGCKRCGGGEEGKERRGSPSMSLRSRRRRAAVPTPVATPRLREQHLQPRRRLLQHLKKVRCCRRPPGRRVKVPETLCRWRTILLSAPNTHKGCGTES